MIGSVLVCLLLTSVGRTWSADDDSLSFYNLFSSITPYDVIKGQIEELEQCEPKAMWGFVRHGTRYPPRREIDGIVGITSLRDSILRNHEKSSGQLTEEEVGRLRSWKPSTSYEEEMLLTDTGVQELKDMGRRLKRYFPDLLDNYKPKHMEIRTSSKTRTQQSARAVFEGIFGQQLEITNDTVYDELIKNEENCYSWKKSTHSKTLSHVLKEFQRSQVVTDLQKSVAERLGFEYPLNFKVVKVMYEACRYEYAWYHKQDLAPWCAVFSADHLKIMEYHQDLTYYYKSAYGNKYTPKLGCEFVKDMIDKLSDDKRKVTLYFGHSLTNRKLLVAMGIGKGTYPLKADGYESSADRQWRSSHLTPFAANLLVVKYQCKNKSDEPQIAIFVNEHLTPLPGYGDKKLYSMEEFEKAFSSLTNDKYCNRKFCHDLS